jgi:molybdopterin-guanine dinucleotide biosynthesis protein A
MTLAREIDSEIAGQVTGQTTGLVLAGGRGVRMGGADKGLLPWAGGTLAGHALGRLRHQAGPLAISANRHIAQYQALGVPVWHDEQAFEGPLGGMLAGLVHCQTPWLLCVPCDAPFFPLDLASRLAQAIATEPGQARMAVARAPSAGPQPVFCLMHCSLQDSLAKYLAAGGRRAGHWARVAAAVWVDFDDEDFRNLNTPEELAAHEAAVHPAPLCAG